MFSSLTMYCSTAAIIKMVTLILWCLKTIGISGYNYNDAANLKATLLNASIYDPTLRPVYNQTKPINLTSYLDLLAIHGLDEVAESLTITASLDVLWRDEYLNWKPEDHGGAELIYIPQKQAWKPDIALKNSLQPYKRLGDDSLNVAVSSTGDVHWKPLEVFLSTCSMDITKFPRDVHTCSLTFVAWGYSDNEVKLGGKGGVVLKNLETNHAWEVIATGVATTTSDYTDITFEITLLRKPTYSMLTLVLPVLILYILNLFVFVLPSDCGEKAGYAVTVFLAFTVFMTVIDSSFPHNSEAVSYFAIFVIGGTVQSTVITIIVLVMVRCASFKDSKDVPRWLAVFVRARKCHGCRSNAVVRIDTTNSQNDEDATKGDLRLEERLTWKSCIDSFDAVFLLLFTTTFALSSLIYFVSIYK